MRLLAVLALLFLAAPALAGADDDARAALALACSLRAKPADLCPCSQTGTCPCVPGAECGCLSSGQYRWVATDKPNQTALYRGGRQLGNYWHAEGEFRRLVMHQDGSHCFEFAACPTALPTAGPSVTVSTPPTYGRPAPVQRVTVPTFYRPVMTAPSFRSSGGGARCSG